MVACGPMPRKQRLQLLVEPVQLAALRLIEERTGANVSEQIRRAIDAYLDEQTIISKAERRRLQKD